MKRFLLPFVAFAIAAAKAPVFYVGAGGVFSEIGWNLFEFGNDDDIFLIPYEVIPKNDWSFKVLGGVEYRSRYAFEIFYVKSKTRRSGRHLNYEDDFGNPVSEEASFRRSFSELGADAIYYIASLGGFRAAVFARAGLVSLDCRFSGSGVDIDMGTRAMGYGGGLGLEYAFS
ncbi:MAG: hypothetical protein LBT92_00470, partial [Rickettsiales bacterium]|nr:hypothetical protein [Rickettsiales bacterium]